MSRIDNLRHILRTLLAEREEYAEWRIPDALEKQQSVMRALLNVRPPQPVSPKFLQAQDAELRQQLADKGIVALSDIPPCQSDSRLRIWQGDITRLQACHRQCRQQCPIQIPTRTGGTDSGGNSDGLP